jgi:hypothetical protein
MAGVVANLANADPVLEDDYGAGRARKRKGKAKSKKRRTLGEKKRSGTSKKTSRMYRAMTSDWS